jgi:peptide/nickel transport system ATP-binding protein
MSEGMRPGDSLVEVRNLKKHYPLSAGMFSGEIGRVRAVDGVDFDIRAGETFGLVGESGCGKSTVATSMLRLEEPTDGEVVFDGQDITTYSNTELKGFRREAQMIFQNPDSSFDPRMSIGESIAEPLKIHGVGPRDRRISIAQNLLERIGMSAGDVHRYPHELSGGQKQRVALARALVVNPRFIVADEPVSALDVSVQAEVLSLLKSIQDEFDLAVLFISHDMSVIQEVCDRVGVMYLGRIVEVAETETVFEDPQHPYTRALLKSVPTLDRTDQSLEFELTGDVPNPSNPPSGCNFHTRCPEIIPPDGYDLGQEEWRSVMDFRAFLERRQLHPEAYKEAAGLDMEGDRTNVPADDIKQEIREEHGIPSELTDTSAERALDEAMTHVVDQEPERAQQLMREEFDTVCAKEDPELQQTDVGHPAACHLHGAPIHEEPAENPAATDD